MLSFTLSAIGALAVLNASVAQSLSPQCGTLSPAGAIKSSRSELSDLAARASDFIYIAGMRSSKAMKPEYAKPFST